MQIADETLRRSIIEEWQEEMSTANLEQGVCGPCGRWFPRRSLSNVPPNTFDLTLLRNDALPAATRPTSYAFNLYQRAFLHPKGMSQVWTISDIHMCKTCRRELVEKGRMPRLCLANWLYYGHDVLPPEAADAFARSSQFDKLLCARARSSRISFRFTELHSNDDSNYDPVDAHEARVLAQRFLKGNVLVMPQNSTLLNSVLPPPASVIRDTVCAVFVGRSMPTMQTIGLLSPVLVRRSTVETIIKFLLVNNPHYAPDEETFFGFSSTNLRGLFSQEQQHSDLGVPCAMEIGFIESNEAITGTSADYTGRNDLQTAPPLGEPILMENVGYTCGDRTPVSYRDMKLRALSHCLNNGRFIRSQAGDTFVPDFHNPALLSWLFPHLDPWGIGGFHHPSRTPEISMEEQISYLLQVADAPFQKDPDFAFVYYNILQKKSVCDSVHFRVKETEQRRIVAQLLQVDKRLLEQLIVKYDADKHYTPQTSDEADLLSLVNGVGAVLRDIPGTAGYKLNMRNEIRALVNFHGTPAFFITLNPSDVHHPLVRLYAGDNISLEDASVGEELTEWRRRLLAARNPGACARFFHTMISNFLSIVLRHGRPEPGLLGLCTAYYGTVEAQARGTLHCHLLVWIKDHPSPQRMRDLMISNEDYQRRLFAWLESVIKCEPLGTSTVIDLHTPSERRRPRLPDDQHSSERQHLGIQRLPRLDAVAPAEFSVQYTDLVNQLVTHFNWHEHTETCWKYLRRNQLRTDANCRMCMDGTTRPSTSLDPQTLSIMLRRLHPWIASYNDLIIFLLQANMDIKHIGSGEGAKALIFYITDYITKASIPTHLGLAALLYAINRTDAKYSDRQQWDSRKDAGALTILVNSMLSRIEISHPQVMSYLIGGGDHYTSHIFRLLYYRTFERLVTQHWEPHQNAARVFTLTGQDVLPGPSSIAEDPGQFEPPLEAETRWVHSGSNNEEADSEDTVTLSLRPGSISAMNQRQDYLLRPASEPFDSMPLYQYTGMTEKITCTAEAHRIENRTQPSDADSPRRGRPEQSRGRFLPPHPQHTTHLVRKRVTWVVPVILNRSLPRSDGSSEETESWSQVVLTLFLPWRTPGDLKNADETWGEAYERCLPDIAPEHHAIIHNMNVLSECKDARDKTMAEMRAATSAETTRTRACGAWIDGMDRAEEQHPVQESSMLSDYPDGVELEGPTPVAETTFIPPTVDELILTAAWVGVDRCFHTNRTTDAVTTFGQVTALHDDDQPVLAAQQTTMRNLKRKRRPSPTPLRPPSSQTRPARLPPIPPLLDISQVAEPSRGSEAVVRPPSLPTYTTADLSGVIRQVVLEFHLDRNPEQLRAFELVARHVCFGGPQLLMYIAGVGGTGKSYVVNAILHLFSLLGRRRQILVSAPTGAAAILIGGYTFHSLLMLPDKEGIDLQPMVVLWVGVLYLIIDEVSMLSATTLAEISLRLQHAKGVSGLVEDIPFGGVNVIFLGDFGQLRPVCGAPLYSHDFAKHPRLQDAASIRGVEALKGVYLWQKLVTTVVILRTNQRQSADSDYASLLTRVREGHCVYAREANIADDFAMLQTRLLQNFDPETAVRFEDAPILVGIKSIRDALNERIVQHYARRIGATAHHYYSQDSIRRTSPNARLQETLWNLPSTITKDALGKLPLFPGMKVMVQENIAFSCNVVNGAIGTVRDIKYIERNGVRHASVVYVHIPGAGKYLHTEDDVVPIFPVTSTFRWTFARKTQTTPAQFITVRRTQLPLLPAYVYTDYKGQGRSLDVAIVDPDSALTLQGVYVMLSRVRTMNGLAILRPFRRSKIEARLSQQLRDEFNRLEEQDKKTRLAYETDRRQYM